jgi:endonuclease G
VSVQRNGVLEVAAFIFDQDTPRSEDLCRHVTTVDEVEGRSHLNLFSGLDADTEGELESSAGTLSGDLGCGS